MSRRSARPKRATNLVRMDQTREEQCLITFTEANVCLICDFWTDAVLASGSPHALSLFVLIGRHRNRFDNCIFVNENGSFATALFHDLALCDMAGGDNRRVISVAIFHQCCLSFQGHARTPCSDAHSNKKMTTLKQRWVRGSRRRKKQNLRRAWPHLPYTVVF